jgi:hypothetical protein
MGKGAGTVSFLLVVKVRITTIVQFRFEEIASQKSTLPRESLKNRDNMLRDVIGVVNPQRGSLKNRDNVLREGTRTL